ncbi:granzyme G-like [Carassius carassius]|uniref:granzyme G-like n=1 Tax=Carassius carassius TaxID=217509 RepID=UPI0028691B6B|nr:granzyme G-like [Carassius carassius]
MSILWHITCLLLLHSCTPGFCMHDGIVGGRVSIPHSRPYMVYIRDKKIKQTCGGFLVREDYVMTAAHCKPRFNHLEVFVGVHDTNFLPDGIEVDPIPHPKFNMKRTDHDIMLLKLKTPVSLSKFVRTITFPNPENEKISSNCLVMGWGWKKYHEESPSHVLKEANVTLIDSENCGTTDTLCSKGSTGPALGDSGGPLVCGGVAHGIVSFSSADLTAYTHIAHYLSWIHDEMKPPTQQQSKTGKGKLDKLI